MTVKKCAGKSKKFSKTSRTLKAPTEIDFQCACDKNRTVSVLAVQAWRDLTPLKTQNFGKNQ